MGIKMIESGAGESPVTLIKNSDAGAEVTKDTAKKYCPMILKVGPPTLLRLQ
jgi:hypothetical protein